MGQKVGSFHRVKNKEQRREKWKIPIGWVHIVNLVWGEKEQGGKYRDRGWLGIWGWPSGYTVLFFERHLSLGLLAWHPWQEQLLLGPRKLFRR